MSTEGDLQLDGLADKRAALRRELADINDGAVSAETAASRLAETLLQADALWRPIEEHLIAMRFHALMVGRLAAAVSAALVRARVFAEKGSYWWLCPVCPARSGHRDRRAGLSCSQGRRGTGLALTRARPCTGAAAGQRSTMSWWMLPAISPSWTWTLSGKGRRS